ncbi:hypothetical protein [Streptomyces sp. NPDC058371]|uniref:hypothetical protein n=1 Tax=Streptomyces sp. NPDC058371 TaxID=3346463 RepID=UPI0036503BA9
MRRRPTRRSVWNIHYDCHRPHSAAGNRPPASLLRASVTNEHVTNEHVTNECVTSDMAGSN